MCSRLHAGGGSRWRDRTERFSNRARYVCSPSTTYIYVVCLVYVRVLQYTVCLNGLKCVRTEPERALTHAPTVWWKLFRCSAAPAVDRAKSVLGY